MITSSANPKMKYVMQLQKKSRFRREEGAFVVEGPKMFLELPRERIRQCFVSESFVPGHEELIEKYGCEIVKDAVFREVSDTQTPQGVLAGEYSGPGKSRNNAAHRGSCRGDRRDYEQKYSGYLQPQGSTCDDGGCFSCSICDG